MKAKTQTLKQVAAQAAETIAKALGQPVRVKPHRHGVIITTDHGECFTAFTPAEIRRFTAEWIGDKTVEQ